MKVLKNGDTVLKRTHKFKCWNCKCKYIASNGEWYYIKYCQKTDKPTDYVESECPECSKTNKIQWRHKKRDWLSENSELVCLLLSPLSFGGMIVSGIFDSIVMFIISFIMFTICMIIKEG